MFGRCSICQDGLSPNEIAALKCGHTFHLHCVSKWLERSTSCPVCCRPGNDAGDIVKQLFFDCGEETPRRSPRKPCPAAETNALLAKVQHLEAELCEKNEKVATYQTEVKNVQKGIRRVQLENSGLQEELTRMREEKDTLRSRLQTLQTLEKFTHRIQRENVVYKADIRRLQAKVDSTTEELETLKRDQKKQTMYSNRSGAYVDRSTKPSQRLTDRDREDPGQVASTSGVSGDTTANGPRQRGSNRR